MSTAELDPFDTAKDEVLQKLNIVTALYELYQEQKQDGSTGEHTLSDLTSELSKNCKTVGAYLTGLEKTVKIVERQPSRFGISQQELSERRRFIQETRTHISGILKELENRKNRARRDDRKNLLANDQFEDPNQSAYARQVQRGNQDFIQQQMLQQDDIRRQQDQGIDRALEATNRIHSIVMEVGDELDNQNRELEELDHEVEQAHSLLKRTSAKMEKLMNVGGDAGKIICIVVLVIVIALMLVLLFGI